MESLFLSISFSLLCLVYCDSKLCGDTSIINTSSCTKQIIGDANGHPEPCTVKLFEQNSTACKNMSFGPITQNGQLGGVHLRPYVLELKDRHRQFYDNITVLNISFSNIKWKTIKFRFQRDQRFRNHCSSIAISNNVTVNDQSVLYYDCYWSIMTDGDSRQSHILDFEAANDTVVDTRRFYFNIPSAAMLSPTISLEAWIPFIYVETHQDTITLHILPPPAHLTVRAYRIELKREYDQCINCAETVSTKTELVKNKTEEVTSEYSLLWSSATYYIAVTPLHGRCENHMECRSVESPRIRIHTDTHETLNIGMVTMTTLIIVSLAVYYALLRFVRKCWCKYDQFALVGKEVIPPPKILIVYSTTNRLHAECVSSFVAYLRSQYGFVVMYDLDIAETAHADPYIWAAESFTSATHILYIAGPSDKTSIYCNIYDQPIISPYRDVDMIQLNLIKSNKGKKNPKEVINVLFEHSDGALPLETKHEKTYRLLKDWQKLIAYLSMNLLPKQQISCSEKGKCLIDDLNRANKLLGNNKRADVVVRCEFNKEPVDKKVLL